MKYRTALLKIIVVLSILLMIGGILLCIELSISPIFGIVTAFLIIILGIFLIPNKVMTYEKVREPELDS